MRTARTLSKAISQMLVESVPLLSFQFALLVCLECPNLSFSLRSLCDLCASAADMPNKAITAEPQRTQWKRRELKLSRQSHECLSDFPCAPGLRKESC